MRFFNTETTAAGPYHRPLLLAAILVAFAVRLFHLGGESLWYDETVSVYLSRLPLPAMFAHTAGDIHPPGYYALLHAWQALTTPSLAHGLEFLYAFPSLVFGLLALPLLYAIGQPSVWRSARASPPSGSAPSPPSSSGTARKCACTPWAPSWVCSASGRCSNSAISPLPGRHPSGKTLARKAPIKVGSSMTVYAWLAVYILSGSRRPLHAVLFSVPAGRTQSDRASLIGCSPAPHSRVRGRGAASGWAHRSPSCCSGCLGSRSSGARPPTRRSHPGARPGTRSPPLRAAWPKHSPPCWSARRLRGASPSDWQPTNGRRSLALGRRHRPAAGRHAGARRHPRRRAARPTGRARRLWLARRHHPALRLRAYRHPLRGHAAGQRPSTTCAISPSMPRSSCSCRPGSSPMLARLRTWLGAALWAALLGSFALALFAYWTNPHLPRRRPPRRRRRPGPALAPRRRHPRQRRLDLPDPHHLLAGRRRSPRAQDQRAPAPATPVRLV